MNGPYSLSINAICLDYGKHLCHFSYLKLLSAPFHKSSLSYYTYMWLYCICVCIYTLFLLLKFISDAMMSFCSAWITHQGLGESTGYYRGAPLG